MKTILTLCIILFISLSAYAQPLTPEAEFLFKDVGTKLTNAEKNQIAESAGTLSKDGSTFQYIDPDLDEPIDIGTSVSVYDFNKDGIEEVVLSSSSTFLYGMVGEGFDLFVKGKDNKYQSVFSSQGIPSFDEHSGKQYPDITVGGPGIVFPVYGWNGKSYEIVGEVKDGEVDINHDIGDEVPADVNRINDLNRTVEVENIPEQLSPTANMLFHNVKSKLTNTDKNMIALLTQVSPQDTLEKTKKGKSKTEYDVYPVDFNRDGNDEIFLRVTNLLLGLPTYNYFFYAKDHSGNYKAAPGKIGPGVRIMLNGKQGYPDLIKGTAGFPREIWAWNGSNYVITQKLNADAKISSELMNVEKADQYYVSAPVASSSAFKLFDGEWHCPDYKYSFQIRGKEGVATLSNSPNYKVGENILRIDSFDGTNYHGQQIFTDGKWHKVTLQLLTNEIVMKGSGYNWKMVRTK